MSSEYFSDVTNTGTLAGRYTKKVAERELYLERARESAVEVTIPTLIPDDSDTYSEKFSTPYQGIGARGVNNLASKLLLSLLPPNAPFFRLSIDNFALKDIETDEQLKTQIEKV